MFNNNHLNFWRMLQFLINSKLMLFKPVDFLCFTFTLRSFHLFPCRILLLLLLILYWTPCHGRLQNSAFINLIQSFLSIVRCFIIFLHVHQLSLFSFLQFCFYEEHRLQYSDIVSMLSFHSCSDRFFSFSS